VTDTSKFTDRYQPDPRHTQLGGAFFDAVAPADFPEAKLRFRNARWAERIGLDQLSDEQWRAHFAAFAPLPDNIPQPLALRYHGHQFQQYNPDLGDGRGFLFAQIRDGEDGRLLDLATKGSGQTPYSRQGDGRLTLKGAVREVLATELLEARGVYTSKSLSVIETGEPLHRGDEPSPTRSAVLVRLGHSHIRFGTFQRLAYHQDGENLKRLTDYAIATYWPEAADADDPVASFYGAVVNATANLAAEWFAAGFVHGVLNTDNMVITGESFDYGPWRFLPTFEPGFTAAYFDQTGLYAFARQPGALHWNLQRLLECLIPLSDTDRLIAQLEPFAATFEARLAQMTCARLGLAVPAAADFEALAGSLIQPFYGAMHASRAPFERTFFDLFGGADPARLSASPSSDAYANPAWQPVLEHMRAMGPSESSRDALTGTYFSGEAPADLTYETVEAIWAPIAADDDWSLFEDAIADIRAAGAALAPCLPARRGHRPINSGDTKA
jgi:uncharacterized protein YdiU (UPF0061 family)